MDVLTEQAADAVSHFANSVGRHGAQEMAELLASDHRTLVQIEADVFIRFFKKLAEEYDRGSYDDRNEAACQRAVIIRDALLAAGYGYDGLPSI